MSDVLSSVLPGAPYEIIDPFAVYSPGTAGVEVPMPLESLRDEESRSRWPETSLVSHLFAKDEAFYKRQSAATQLDTFLAEQDRAGIVRSGVPLLSSTPDEIFDELMALKGRVFITLRINPHDGMRGVLRAQELVQRYPIIRSLSITPFQIYPFIAPNSKEYYPLYAKAAELGVAVFMNVGFPGPRVPAWVQDPIHLDEVCWFFPELTVVMRHGGLPWAEVCVQMMLRWPNLYYATTAVAPKYWAQPIVDFANTRGSNKIIFAGYWPLMSYERVFGELAVRGIRETTFPKLLAENARRAFRLDD
jgi:uncharacterized protein